MNFKAKNTPGNPKLIFWTPLEIKLLFKLTTGIWTCYFFWNSMSSTPCPLLGLFWNSQISGWLEYQEKLVENFMGSNAILCGGADSGQTIFLMLWYWTTAIFLRIQLWNWKSNIFSQLPLQAQFFFISQLPEGLGMRKIFAHSIRMQRIHKHQGAQFLDFHWAMWV